MLVEIGSAIWFKWKHPFWWISWINCWGRMWFWALPSQESTPILTFVLSPTFQTRPSDISEKDLHKDFHMMDPLLCFLNSKSLIQSRIEVGVMYLWVITSIHRLYVVMSLHPNFAAKALAKKVVFLMPQPPNAFGLAIWSHFTHGRTFWSFFSAHRKYEHIILDISRLI